MAPGIHSVPAGGIDAGPAVESGSPAVPPDLAADVSAVASLDEPTRRRVYDYVGGRTGPLGNTGPLSREDVAAGLGVPLRTAAFHLDRLAQLGLLSVTFARLTGRSGPGAGRPAKLYRRSSREVAVSLPPRHYDLAGRLLAGAMAQAEQSGERPRKVLERQARDFGRALAREQTLARERRLAGEQAPAREPADERLGGRSSQGEMGLLIGLLEDNGFEPRFADDDILLQNCPFHSLAQEQTQLVCGMNLHLLEGVLDGLTQTGLEARLDPEPSRCCVRLEQAVSVR